jgi:D-alanine-D-alanine ligase
MIECSSDLPVLVLVDVNPRWEPAEIQDRITGAEILTLALQQVGHQVNCIYVEKDELPESIHQFHPEEVVVLNLCDEIPGIPRSCALFAQLLEKQGYTFSGADSQALTRSQDKRIIKDMLTTHGIRIPKWKEVYQLNDFEWTTYPAIIKPAFEHCSNGITRNSVVKNREELNNRARFIDEAFRQPVMVEEFIDGPEFSIGVVGNETLWMLPPAEIDFSSVQDVQERLFTYDAKFTIESPAYQTIVPKIPARLSPAQGTQLEHLVKNAYRLTGCRDYARMDVRLRDGNFYLLDVNHNAAITPETSFVLSAYEAGLSYGQFGSLLVNLVAQRHTTYGKDTPDASRWKA